MASGKWRMEDGRKAKGGVRSIRRMARRKSSRVATRCDTQININCRGECKGYLQQPSEAHMGCPIEHEIGEEWQVRGSERGQGEREEYFAENGLWHLARATIDSHINPNIVANLPLLGRIFMEQKDNVCGKGREAERRERRRVVDIGGGDSSRRVDKFINSGSRQVF